MTRNLLVQLTTIAFLVATPVSAQEGDATVVLPGVVRLDLRGEYLRVDSRFGEIGAADPWSVEGTLGPLRLPPVRVAADAFDAFVAATGAGGASGANGSAFSAGDLDLDASVATRYLPIRLAAGILPRLEVGVTVPIVRTQRLIRRFEVAAGNLGKNPSIAANSAILSRLGGVGTTLGASPILPVSGTPAGDLLQARAVAATGQTLALPAAPLTLQELASELGFDRAPYEGGVWELGDPTIDARLLLLSTFSDLFPEPGSERDFRVALIGSYRLPLRLGPDGPIPSPFRGYSGFTAGVIGDVFIGPRFWMSVGASGRKLEPGDDVGPPVVDPLMAGSGIGLGPPADGVDIWATPRFRLTREISFGASLQAVASSGGGPVGSTDSAGGTVSSAGFSVRYSSLPGVMAGEQIRPLDVSIGYTRGIAGPEGADRLRRAFVQLSILPRLWGRGRTVASEP